MDIALDEVLHFDAVTSSFSTGAATDADSTPTWAIYEEDTDTAVQSGNFTKRTSLTGNYRASVTLSAANGFETGKWYNVIGSATVSSVAGKGVVMRFRVVPAETAAGVPKVDVSHFGGTAGTFSGGREEVNTSHLAGTAYASADLSATMKASVNTEADTALTDYGALKPTTAGRTLDVSAGGEAGIDWANVGSPTTTLNLSGTTVKSVTDAVVATISGTLTTIDSLWTEIKRWLRIMIRSDAFIAGDYSDVIASINESTGSGIGSYNNTTESLRAIHAHADETQTLATGIKAKTDNLPAAPAATGDIPSAATIADAVWDESLASHLAGGSTGAGLNAAGSAGDPWSTALPGAYSAGSAGYILGTNLNAAVGSRSSHSAADVWSVATRTLTAFGFTVTTSDSSNITAILADTNELQTDWANGGRLDLILDARASQTSVDDVPTVAEFEARTIAAATYATAANLATVAGYLDTEIAAILEDTGTTLPAQISGLTIPTSTQIADAVLSRNVSNVEASAGEHTLCTVILAALQSNTVDNPGFLTIYRTNGSTPQFQRPITTDAAADPITGVS